MKTQLITLALVATPVVAFAAPDVPRDHAAVADLLARGREKAPEADAAAPEASAAPKVEETNPMGPITSMFGIAFGVAGLMVAGAFVMKRLKSKGMFDAANNELRLEESLWVGRGQRLLLVSVGERRVLLGVTGAGFEGLAVLDQEVGPAGGLLSEARESGPLSVPPTPAPRREPDARRTFAQVLNDDVAFKPSPSDRRRIIQRLNTL